MDATLPRITGDEPAEKGRRVMEELGTLLKQRGLVDKVEHVTVREEHTFDKYYSYFHYKDLSVGVLRIQYLPFLSDAKDNLSSIGELIDTAALESSKKRFGALSIQYENGAYLGKGGIKMVYYQSKTEYSADAIEEKLSNYDHRLVSPLREEPGQIKYGDG